MKKVFLLLAFLLLAACGNENNSTSPSANKGNADKNGTFKATMGDTNYEVAIRCYQFDNDKFDTEFTFASDIFGNEDTDGDGIIIRGDKVKLTKETSPIEVDGVSLDIVDHGVRWSAHPVIAAMEKRETWTKTSNGITGTDKMSREETSDVGENTLPITYEVICK